MQWFKFRSYKLHYTDRGAAEAMVRQIDEFPSFFQPSTDRPFIIDGGANIGVSVLEWKTRWPGSQIICFEPDPYAFAALKRNIDVNDIPSVRCFNVALSDFEGESNFFGDISPQGDARGNSIDPAWGDREGTMKSIVKCKKLSPFIGDHVVSFLKLDIEGAEQRVLTEIAGQLAQIEALYIEIHQTDASDGYNSAIEIASMIEKSGFTIEADCRQEENALPAHLAAWQEKVGARQTQLIAWR